MFSFLHVFLSLQLNRPLPVTPYQRHVNKKRKPAESLRQSGIMPDTADRNKTDSLSDLPVDISSNLTPPDTPRSAVSADQSSPDQMSLDGKDPGYENITFTGKVASGNSGINKYGFISIMSCLCVHVGP